ncbi:MAG: NAD-dependent epimerase/dehydratase family protein [Gammaproteobacteria bacterium]|nr:NAD-dependent epimerase/dehydratase family protein [Gammaproteobacteria bacterium]
MYKYEEIKKKLLLQPRTWLITGVAGFIGSNLLEQLLLLNQKVIGIDNLSSGKMQNINRLDKLDNFEFYQVDIADYAACKNIFDSANIDFVLHQAAVASVPLSIINPKLTSKVNIDGFNNVLELSKESAVKTLVYASSSAVYGDNDDLEKLEPRIGNFLSPYAVSKYVNELYAEQYSSHHNLTTIGLRYFNIYGKHQDPKSTYSAVIPKWINQVINQEQIYIYGDGRTTRDFCHVDNVVQANILACFNGEYNQVYNIGVGSALDLDTLLGNIIDLVGKNELIYNIKPIYKDFIAGDIKHSCANIKLAQAELNYTPNTDLSKNLETVYNWLINVNAVDKKQIEQIHD